MRELLTATEWQALVLSIQVASVCVAVSVVPGIAVAWLLARTRFAGKSVVSAIVHAPLVLPPVVVGYVLLLILGRNGFIGSYLERVFGVQIAFTWWALVLASAVMGFPLLVRSVRISLELVDRRLEEAASTLGCGPWGRLLRVTLPLTMPGILAGLTLSFARSLGEFGASIMFAGNISGRTQTLPLAIFSASQQPGGDFLGRRLVVISVLLSVVTVIVSEWLARHAYRRVQAS